MSTQPAPERNDHSCARVHTRLLDWDALDLFQTELEDGEFVGTIDLGDGNRRKSGPRYDE